MIQFSEDEVVRIALAFFDLGRNGNTLSDDKSSLGEKKTAARLVRNSIIEIRNLEPSVINRTTNMIYLELLWDQAKPFLG
ncbi:MAG: hypothetical protein Q7R33_03425 [Nitrosarchaeum sp.]|nr:hypothetical protein [Nitrosarchaeum sp.]